MLTLVIILLEGDLCVFVFGYQLPNVKQNEDFQNKCQPGNPTSDPLDCSVLFQEH